MDNNRPLTLTENLNGILNPKNFRRFAPKYPTRPRCPNGCEEIGVGHHLCFAEGPGTISLRKYQIFFSLMFKL